MLAGQQKAILPPVTSRELPYLAPSTQYFSLRAPGWITKEEYMVLETDGAGRIIIVTRGADAHVLKLNALPFVQDGGRLSLELTPRVADAIAGSERLTAAKCRRTDMFELREGGRLVGFVAPLRRANVLELGIEHILANQKPLR